MRRDLLVLSMGVVALAAALSSRAQAAPTKKQCVDDNAGAQELQRDGHLAAASERLKHCAVRSCPAIVREDCTLRLNDLKKVQPTLVFEVKTPAGTDIVSLRVSMDSQFLTDHMDGTPLPIDPGPHAFIFEVAGQRPVTYQLMVREGEVARHERVVIGEPPPAAPTVVAPLPAAPAPQQPTEVPSHGPGARRVIGLSAAGLGMVAVVVGTVSGLRARSAWSEAKTACNGDPSHCSDVQAASAHRSTAVSDGNLSTVAFVAGGVLLAGGAFLAFTGGAHDGPKADGVAVVPSVGPQGAALLLQGGF
ncbi:MAG TPA: hypothetical protein VNO55_32915 [Polyangia bacterium]|nr:hypothetical protein [Polyangia bacterium]